MSNLKPVTVRSLVQKIEKLRDQKKGRAFIKAALKAIDPKAITTLQAKIKAKTLRGEDKVVAGWLFEL